VSEQESVAQLLHLMIAVPTWIGFYISVGRVHPLLRRGGLGWLVLVAPAACVLVLLGVLLTLAASDVRDSVTYLFFYLLGGVAWLGASVWTFGLLGIHVRDDVFERRNHGAAFLAAGAMLAVTLCFAGANVGDGPGFWVVWFSTGLACATLALLWVLLQLFWPVVERVSVERDVGAGRRAALLLVAVGLVLGRAAAGDWISAGDTVRDFVRHGWPALVLVVGAGLFEGRRLRLGGAAVVTTWLVPGLVYLAGAAGTVIASGRP
jgi:hypothetical protein